MSKLDLMKKFMETFVGNGLSLIVKDGNYFHVYSIEIFQKMDETCPLKGVSVGDYFLRLWVKDENGREAAILCDWSEQLIQSLLEHAAYAKEAGYNVLMMQRAPQNLGGWIILWGDKIQNLTKQETLRKTRMHYVS
ncbi:MAG: hypothetical protein QXW82_07300 [Candidatus Bathyarchaeia archaeon]